MGIIDFRVKPKHFNSFLFNALLHTAKTKVIKLLIDQIDNFSNFSYILNENLLQ